MAEKKKLIVRKKQLIVKKKPTYKPNPRGNYA